MDKKVELGKAADIEISFSAGQLKIEFDVVGGPGSIGLIASVSSDKLIDELEAALPPGVVSDTVKSVLELMRASLKQVA